MHYVESKDKLKLGNIIVANASPGMSETISRYIMEEGYGVYICESFSDVVHVNHDRLKAIVVDVSDVESNAIHSVEVIKQSPIGMRLPMLLICDLNDDDMLIDALNAGADDYLIMPFTRHELVSRLRQLMRRYE